MSPVKAKCQTCDTLRPVSELEECDCGCGLICRDTGLCDRTMRPCCDAAVAAERERIRQLAKRESFTLYRPGNGPGAGHQQAIDVVPLAALMQDQP